MRALFVPCVHAPVPHLVPLLALASRLDPGRHETAFLVPRVLHAACRATGQRVLDMDYEPDDTFRAEMHAYDEFDPDIVVDDLSLTALASTTLSGRPRVAITRSGAFVGVAPRNPKHRHSCFKDRRATFERCRRLAPYAACEARHGLTPPRTVADLCAAAVRIVPGIRAIEAASPAIADDGRYVFAGPLVVSDDACVRLMRATHVGDFEASALERFCERHRDEPLVYLTVGTMLHAGDALRAVLRHLLASGAVVVTNVEPPGLASPFRERCLTAPILPMSYVCSRARLMIHHCGSGTYQYQVRHGVPAICIGSGCYDRDDVAMRLQELGVAAYIPGPDEIADFEGVFRTTVDRCLDTGGRWYQDAVRRLHALRSEGESTAAGFDAEAVLDRAWRRGR